ncbi:unnamed protein product (macronuclear) [Paramecium tetraurelia]|uniref:Palmitoyltransferase n=1 Tax=Paramecium tetraurelia TaxID=5888 RepID=A0DNW9_PARTE|nr:uncharacterized protein GSPATT00018932001 [Paramecium tetraurelia]CAK84736.1 unnamed protein product [Paramecium tetraurelia]|eukprot:XP_001452133.1 hypothetical protein (macronuclear) [Paramecium tetraurelia strain d4-2]
MDFEYFEKQDDDDDDDMNVQFDEEDIKYNIEDSKKPIEKELDDSEISQIEMKINKMKEEESYFDHDSDDDTRQKLTKAKEWKRHFGNYTPLIFINDEPIFAISPQWIINLFVIVALLVITYFQFTKPKQKTIQYCITIIINVLELLGYVIAAVMNPGINTSLQETLNKHNNCQICEIVQYRKDTYHCEICNVCIREFHHHSNFLGRCIGQGNLFYYYLSILFLPLFLINLIVLYVF